MSAVAIGAIERTVLLIDESQLALIDHYAAVGAEQVIIGVGTPFDLSPVERALAARS
jgi:hypothetical protein